MTSGLKAFFADTDAATYHNLERAIMPGEINQSVTYTLETDDTRDKPPSLLTIWKGQAGPGKEQTREYIYMDPDDARDVAKVLTAYADAWQGRWRAYEGGGDIESPPTSNAHDKAGWQPIETAPYEGFFLVCNYRGPNSDYGVSVAVVWRDGGRFCSHLGECDGDPVEYIESPSTHWMPLPEKPRASQ